MSVVRSIGTYLPLWGSVGSRVVDEDEDTVTMAVEAGRAALQGDIAVERVVVVTRDSPLLEGGIAAILLGGLDLDPDIEVTERLGRAAATLDAIASAWPRTLVIGVDLAPAGAGAVVVGDSGLSVRPIARIARSLPVRTRDAAGVVHDYGDPRLLRERGVLASLTSASTAPPRVVVGLDRKLATSLSSDAAPEWPTNGASAPIFALAWMSDTETRGPLIGFDQATLTSLAVDSGKPDVHRVERPARPVPKTVLTPGAEIPISLAAYERAFTAKVRWVATRPVDGGEIDFPPRTRVGDDGALLATEPVALPRTGSVYTAVTIRAPIPGLRSPYSLAIVELDEIGVRALLKVSGAEPGSVAIGDHGRMVLRRVAVRSGVPDYGFAFLPDENTSDQEVTA